MVGCLVGAGGVKDEVYIHVNGVLCGMFSSV